MKYNIVFATDQNYIQHLAVALVSLLENNEELYFNIYIINGGIDKDKLNKLEQITYGYNCKLINIEINDSIFEKLVKNHHFTKANYYRLLIAEFIKEEKVLYLDADIVVNASIEYLYNENIDNFYIGAVDNPGFDRHDELNMTKTAKYFNSGVMLINVKKWKETNLLNNVISFVTEHSSAIKFVDQCGLNSVINGNWKQLELKFNQQAVIFDKNINYVFDSFSKNELNEAIKNPVIIHYTGSSKPWHFKNKHPYKRLYWKYLKMTPFNRYVSEDLTIINLLKWMIPNKIKEFFKKKLNYER
jgi:lipopolysaccharide biosynthesis glycosyltransferase